MKGSDIIKAISIREPWASMILRGEKTIETRTWKTKYRGWLLLCASQKPKSDISGKAFALAYLSECRLMTWGDQTKACCAVFEGAWAWTFSKIIPLKHPFPVKGQLRLFDVPEALMFAYARKGEEDYRIMNELQSQGDDDESDSR